MAPDQQALSADLTSARFLSGEDRNRWKLQKVEWPYLYVTVNAHDTHDFTLRLNCNGFPSVPPTGTFWNLAANIRLDFTQWPRGSERLSLAFRSDWKNGNALYIPCDRESIEGHDGWVTQYPQLIWNPTKGISHYLEIVHDLLQSHENIAAWA